MLSLSMASSTPHFVSHKRPKLSLQTTALPLNFSCTSTALAPMTMSAAAATPTTANTFNNTYDLSHRPTPAALVAAKASSRLARSQSPKPTRRNDRTYHLPYGVKSILKNSETAGYATASPSTGTRKVFFPQAKKVAFRLHLEEEIINKHYTARHSDLVWEDEGDVVESIEEESNEETEVASAHATTQGQRSSLSLSFSETKQITPRSISATQSRKKRRWEWTLSPVKTSNDDNADYSDLDSDWVVVSIQRQPSEEAISRPSKPAKRRAASLDTDERPAAKKRTIRPPVRSHTL